MMYRHEVNATEIAVTGMAGRFPGAPDVDTFWTNLRAGVESITGLSEEDLRAEGVPVELLARPEYVRAASVIDGIDQFDAEFFGISAREAALLDPQHRLFLETSWHALENAGRGPGTDHDVGVFAGANMPAYLMSNLLGGNRIVTSPAVFELQIHNDKDYLASRTAFLLGLTGPAVTVQAACASSLVAVHQAARALQTGDCGTALAGGVCVRVPHRVGYLYEKGLIYSPDGHCRPFDADAGGTVFGNGVGVVVLRRLADAIADGDQVLAVLRVTAINNDGDDKVGYTAPSVAGQQRLISSALATAEFEASSITALEAHGTGTQVGDPIEITALSRAFAEHTDKRGFCAVSSVKSNIGHLETAAGVASMIKAVQQLRHRELAPSLHFHRPNPRIDFDSTPFYVAAELTPWPGDTYPRRIGVSSFGIGGSNAHVILEESPNRPATTTDTRDSQILVLSARSRRALDQATQDLARHLETVAAQGEAPTLAQLATSSQIDRAPQRFRRALVARDLTEVTALLSGAEPARVPSSVAPPTAPKLLFLFPGQGSQYTGMGRDLYFGEPVYRDVVDECAEVLAPLLEIDLRAALYPEPGADLDSAAHRLEQTSLAQPALFVTEYALACQLAAWGIVPDAMVGHSLGEFVAACLAGVFDLHDVLRLVAARGSMMQRLPAGGMISVAAAEDDLANLLSAELSIAAVNAPSMCVVSGPPSALDALRERLDGQDVPSRPLHTSHAFHSAMIDPIVPAFTDLVGRIELGPPGQAVLSTVTGRWITTEQTTDPTYWGSHMRRPVRFGQALRAAVDALGRTVLLEVGPGNTLSTLSRHAIEPTCGTTAISGMRRADHQEPDVDLLLRAVAGMWLSGVEIDWTRLQPTTGRTRLPAYPFQHKRYWIEPRTTRSGELIIDTPAAAEEDEGAVGSRPEHLLSSYAEPRTGLECELARVWEDSFGFSPIGLHDNFFELGGHSLMATQMLNRLSAKLGRVATLVQLLANPTVAALAGLLDQQQPAEPGGELPPLVPQPDRRYEPFPLTEMQQAQWLGRLGSFDMGGVAPHLYLEFDSSTLDRHRLEWAWRQVVRRHEMLRIIVLPEGRQRVLDEPPAYRFAELDLRGGDPAQAREQLAELSERMATQVRPADEWPLWEIRVTRLAEGTLRTHISFDLLCADVASFFYQVLPAWRDFYAEPERPSHPAELSFRDYVLAEEALRETPLYERSLEYWRGRVRELPAAPELPTVQVAAEIVRPTFVRRHASVAPDIWARIKERASEHGVTPSSVLVAAYAATVARWSRSQHFTLNFTAVNRLPFHPEVDDVVGEFASFELLEVDVRELGTFRELAEQVQRQSWTDFEHRHVSGVRILRELNRVRRDTTGGVMPVVFTSALSTEQNPASVPSPVDWLGEQACFISQTPQVSIDHFVLEFGGVLELAWHAVDELFPDELMAEMFAAYQELLFSLVDEQGWQRPPSAHPPRWQEHMRACANATAGPVPTELLCTDVLAAGSQPRTADLPAIITAERTLSHRELSGRAVAVAGELTASGRSRGSVIGVGLDKGWRQVVAAVGASAAGCTYVPIDPDLPLTRRAWLIEHAGVESVLVDPADAHEWPEGVPTVAVPDEVDWQQIAVADWVCPAKVEDIAYVIYTSGSTGTPKGVAVCHTAALNTLDDVRERFGITELDRVLGLSSLSFDLSVFDVFGMLGAAAAVVLPETAARRDPQRWWELVCEHNVSVWNSVPALFEMLVTHLENDAVRDAPVPLRLAMLSGDWIPVALPDRARALVERLEVVSLGGATEAAIWSIAFPVGEVARDWTAIPYGFPLRNQTFHVLNDRLEPAPVWTAGELFIGGLGLANGYWNDPERTAASFIIHPDSGERLYRTGDLGRYLPDGCIEFLGREDLQVKIGGFRVELGEVEYAITRHPQVATAVAVATGARTQQRLVAYLVASEVTANAEELVNSIRTHLASTVPAYLIPADFVVLDELPLSSNGKLDRSALPAPEHAGGTGAAEPVEERLRETLAQLLAVAGDVLGVPALGAQDNFFAVGGDSIVGIQLVGRANTTGLKFTPQDLFESSTFLELAQRASQAGPGAVSVTVSPLTPHQRSLTETSIVGWVATALRPGTDPDLVERAFHELTLRHAALRVRLGESDDGFTGHHDGEVFTDEVFTEMDLTALPAQAIGQAIEEIVAEMAQEIDPRTTPPVKMALVRTTAGDQLLWLARAAAVDDPSWQLLLADFAHAYTALAEGSAVEWNGLAADGAAPLRPGERGDCAPTGRRALSGWLHTVLDSATVAELRAATFGSYHLSFTEALAAALAVASRNVPGAPPAISVERPLRTPANRDAVGRLSEVVTVDLAEVGTEPADVVPAVKREYRRAVPGPLDVPRLHLHEIAEADWQPSVGPLVLDGFTGPRQDATTTGAVGEIAGAVVSGELRLCWQFTGEPGPLTAVAETFADAVQAVVEHCKHSATGSYEPSDFPLSGLGAEELDDFLRTLG